MTAPLRTSLDFGLGWAARGIKIIPLIPGTNRPAIKDWPNAASSDPAVIRRWASDYPGCGWGAPTGSANPTLGLVTDIDTKHGDGMAELREWLARENLAIPDTMWADTPNGGWHIYLATPPGVVVPTRRLPNVDFQGDGVFVALPPTRARLKPRTFPPPDGAPGYDELYLMLTSRGEPAPASRPALYGAYMLAGPPRVAASPPGWLEAVSRLPSRAAGRGGGTGGHVGAGDRGELPPTKYLLEHGVPDGMKHDDTLTALAGRLVAEGKTWSEGYPILRRVADLTAIAGPWTDDNIRRKWGSAVGKDFGKVPELAPGAVQWAQSTVMAASDADMVTGTVMRPPVVVTRQDGLRTVEAARWVTGQGALLYGADNQLWAYQYGVWVPGENPGSDIVHERIAWLLGNQFRQAHGSNIKEMIRAQVGRLRCDPVPEMINFRDGLLRWRDPGGQVSPHDPAVLSTVQLAVNWNPAAQCPRFDAFLAGVLPPEDVPRMWEVIGYLMMPGNPLHKIILLYGRGFNGNGVLLRTLIALLGEGSVSSVSLHSLADERFTRVNLLGKIANICGDIDATYIERTGLLKQLTGEDLITADDDQDRREKRPHRYDNKQEHKVRHQQPMAWRRHPPGNHRPGCASTRRRQATLKEFGGDRKSADHRSSSVLICGSAAVERHPCCRFPKCPARMTEVVCNGRLS